MDGYIGMIMPWAGSWAPQDWLFCQGQTLSINTYAALYSIVGTTYGGDGRTNFALPDLRSRMPIGAGQGPGLSLRLPGQQLGVEQNQLSVNQLPPVAVPLQGNATVQFPGQPATTAQATSTTPAADGSSFPGKIPTLMIGDNEVDVPAYATGTPNCTLKSAGSAPCTISGQTAQLGLGAGITNMPPALALNYIICVSGLYPDRP